MELWIPIIAAAFASGGLLNAAITRLLNRKSISIEREVKEHDSTIAGMALLIDQLQEERKECKAETAVLRGEIAVCRAQIEEMRSSGR
jgi:hypothetical protein